MGIYSLQQNISDGKFNDVLCGWNILYTNKLLHIIHFFLGIFYRFLLLMDFSVNLWEIISSIGSSFMIFFQFGRKLGNENRDVETMKNHSLIEILRSKILGLECVLEKWRTSISLRKTVVLSSSFFLSAFIFHISVSYVYLKDESSTYITVCEVYSR